MSWQLSSFAVLAVVIGGGLGWYERRRPPARVVAIVAAMAALAVVGRLAFAAIPNVKPTTDIVLFAGYALGPVPGFAVGAVTALVSNVFLGQGPWTAWQMASWGAIGVGGGLLARATGGRELGRVPLAAACGAAGLAFGAVLDLYQTTLTAQPSPASYAGVAATSLPYNLAHAIGNVGFSLLIGPLFIRALRRYRQRFEVRWEAPARAVAAATVAGLAVVVALTAAPVPSADAAASPGARAAAYLARVQNRDGGFGGARGQASSQLFTGWSALGLASARRNPRDVARRGGRAITTYLRRGGSLTDTGELERTILVLKASGLSPRRFAGRDLVAALLGRRRADGSWRRNVALTAFGVLALRAAGESAGSGPVQRAANWLGGAQNTDGGFGFVPSAQSDVDDTGAVLQALVAAGRRGGPAVAGGLRYLRAGQGSDGGFGQMKGRSSNAQSTAWAVQGLVAAGVAPGSVGADPIRYLARLQRRDGHVAYSQTSDQTPVWVTAQALTALTRKPFPLATVPRRKRARRHRSRASASSPARGEHTPRARRATASGQRALAPDAVPPRRPRQLRGVSPQRAGAKPARVETHGADPALLAVCGGAALALVALLRRRLRSRRQASPA